MLALNVEDETYQEKIGFISPELIGGFNLLGCYSEEAINKSANSQTELLIMV